VKSAIVLIVTAMFGSLALAQPATAPRAPAGAGLRASTNDVIFWAELRDLQAKLRTSEATLISTDPEIKALTQQCKDAQQLMQDLDKKRREMIAAKQLADPAVGPLLKRRAELMVKIQGMRSAVAVGSAGPEGVPAPPQAPAKSP
jgi:hypothetical protein